MKIVCCVFLWILLSCSASIIAQSPTEFDKSLFEDWMGDYLLEENAIDSYCVKYTVVASETYHGSPEKIESSINFLAVNKKKKLVRYDFIGESLNEEGKEMVLGIRHLQNDKEFYFGQGESNLYTLSKLDRSFLTNWDGRPINPFFLPFGAVNASRSTFGLDSLFGVEVCNVNDIRVAWSADGALSGCVNGKTDNSMICTFDMKIKKPIKYSVYLHPRDLAVDKPQARFRPTLRAEVKWREIPKLGWRPVEAVEFVDAGFSAEPVKCQYTTKVTWWSEEIPDRVFLPEDMKLGLEHPTIIQDIFK